MKVDTQTKQNVENKEDIVQLQSEDGEILTDVNMPFADFLSQQLEGAENSLSLNNYSTGIDYDYNSLSMNAEDALFFVNLAKEGQFSVETAQNGDFKSIMQLEVSQTYVTQKTVEVTNQLTSLIEKAQTTQKPVRISFDNDVSVVLKVDKEGKVSAEFIPGNSEVESYLRNNIASLKQRFDEQNLPYNDLLYRQSGRQSKNGSNKDKKEGSNA